MQSSPIINTSLDRCLHHNITISIPQLYCDLRSSNIDNPKSPRIYSKSYYAINAMKNGRYHVINFPGYCKGIANKLSRYRNLRGFSTLHITCCNFKIERGECCIVENRTSIRKGLAFIMLVTDGYMQNSIDFVLRNS